MTEHLQNIMLEKDQREYVYKLQGTLHELVQGCVDERGSKEPTAVLLEQLQERLSKREEIPNVYPNWTEYQRGILEGQRLDDFDFVLGVPGGYIFLEVDEEGKCRRRAGSCTGGQAHG